MSNRSGSGTRWRRPERWAAWVAGLVVIGGVLVAACSAAAVRGRAGPFVYVADSKRDEISQFKMKHSGALRPLKPATVPAGSFPYGIIVSPQGTSVYVANVKGNEVSQYTINPASGQLTPKTPATVAAGRGSVEVAVTPNDKSAYVVDQNDVSQYSINPTTGKLTPKSPATVTAGRNSEAMAISPNGKYVYVSNCPRCRVVKRGSHHAPPPNRATAGSTICEYRIDHTTGALTRVGSVATGSGANGIAITPNGKSLYVAVAAVWQYTINPTTGKLTRKSPPTVAALGTAHEIQVAPDGKNAYVAGGSTISQYRVNARTGGLSSRPISTARAVPPAEALKLAPDGTSAYVTNEGYPGKLSQFRLNPTTGKITPVSPTTVKTASGALGLAITP